MDTNTVMARSTTSASTARPLRAGLDDAAISALVCAASAGVHGALVVPHATESSRMAVAFALTTLGLGAAAAGLTLRPSPAMRSSAAALLLAVASAYLMSRTSGVPGLAEQPEPFDTLGTTLSLVELAAAVVAVRQLNPRRHS